MTTAYTIYLVEDEENLSGVLKPYMEKEGWEVTVFDNGTEALEAKEDPPHLWVLDIMLPGTDGYQILKEIRSSKKGEVPVIFISARDQDLDRVLGLEMGSDDYLAKPFLPQELIIRAKKLLSRIYGESQTETRRTEVNNYYIDPEARTVTDAENNDTHIELTTKEMDLILLLTEEVGKALSREDIIEHVWGENYFGSERAVDDVVRRVRKKMPRIHLETLYGYGYRVLPS
ncbi:DNA-binding response regulator [Marinococcus halophilus]|uniref:Transcriptional regulatory protein CssR n=1 Tax=Marinococcus halophilus TaxID=1371 RepID=A0A510Y655_MARHA|nr:response regulator transcription factor [Marinococcus halophilus]OZT81126.1 DNA-binding response regulator [Marinococcus halophilus]GEK58849.1 transcriptional regulatory protein CssR [Marinococcus halophilus]